MNVLLTRSVFASVAHRYWNASWSNQENLRVYGADASCDGIGSNLRIDLSMVVEDENVLVEPLRRLKGLVDHQCLFFEHASSLEQMTEDLARAWGGWFELRVWESERLSCARAASGELSLRFSLDNLTFEIKGTRDPQSGLIASRDRIRQAVLDARRIFIEQKPMATEPWADKIFHHFEKELKGLKGLRIDLGSHEYLQLQA